MLIKLYFLRIKFLKNKECGHILKRIEATIQKLEQEQK